MHDFLVRSEAHRYLHRLKRQFLNLPNDDFPCEGAKKIWELFYKILETINDRLECYSTRQIQLINTLLPNFERFCGVLNDSRTANVPWSIIPSIETLFSEIRPESKFVIAPLWEINYAIYNRNIIELLDHDVLSVKGLLFDDNDRFEECKENFLKDIGKEIFILFYPRSERLSVLQFPILGHEIGHIYAKQWIDDHFGQFVQDYNLEDHLIKHAENATPDFLLGTLFADQFKISRFSQFLEVYRKILAELFSDFIGVLIFGHTALLSSYIFAIKHGLDNGNSIQNGYLPWRFRLFFMKKILVFQEIPINITSHPGLKNWFVEIGKIIEKLEIKFFHNPSNGHEYLKHLIDILNSDFERILDSIQKYIPAVLFKDTYNEHFEHSVFCRLSDEIIPNCVMDDQLKEHPIDLRNIVAGTWLFVCEQQQEKSDKFVKRSNQANLLSLKGIELSHLQSRVVCR